MKWTIRDNKIPQQLQQLPHKNLLILYVFYGNICVYYKMLF